MTKHNKEQTTAAVMVGSMSKACSAAEAIELLCMPGHMKPAAAIVIKAKTHAKNLLPAPFSI